MGNWKYINGVVIIVALGFMYRYFAVRYQAGAMVYILATSGALIIGGIGYYIFVYRMRQTTNSGNRPKDNTITKSAGRPTPPAGRPKVVFNKGHDGTDKQ